jgi:hypothetical protein
MSNAQTFNLTMEQVDRYHGGLRVGTSGNYIVQSDGGTGGSGSGGSGNQYIEIEVNDTVYKVLHDGTV